MGWFNNINTQTKLLIAFGVIALISTLATGLSVANMIAMQTQVHQIQQKSDEIVNIANAQASFLNQTASSNAFVLTGDGYYSGMAQHFQNQFDAFLRRGMVNSTTPDESEDLTSLDKLMADYTDAYNKAETGFMSSPQDENSSIYMNDAYVASLGVNDQVNSMSYKRQLELSGLAQQADTLVRSTAVTSGIFLAFLAGFLILAALITNQSAEPLLHLTNAVAAFENNAYEPGLLQRYLKRKDDIGQLARAVDSMVSSITQANKAREQFMNAARRFIPTQYLDFLDKPSITDVKLGDHVSAEMAVMFSDVRGFTTLSERMTARENFDFVNQYLSMVSPIVQKHNGFIVKFLGDGMMAIFPYGVDDAVQAGIEKEQMVKIFNEERSKSGQLPIAVGIGIHTGHMMVGMIGEEKRMQGDAFSDNVNLTSRLEGLTKYFGVNMIISEETSLRLEQPGQYEMRPLGRVRVKGRDKPIMLYDVFGGDPPELRADKLETRVVYEAGIQAYQAGKFAQAKQAFESMLRVMPNDKTSAMYLNLATEYAANGAPAGWDGVINMTEK